MSFILKFKLKINFGYCSESNSESVLKINEVKTCELEVEKFNLATYFRLFDILVDDFFTNIQSLYQ